jgi:hypothetical protein
MKKIVFAGISSFCFLIAKSQVGFIQSFKQIDTLKLSIENYNNFKKIEGAIILEKVCLIKNECLYNLLNNREIHYYGISKFYKESLCYLLLKATDTYKTDIYMLSYDTTQSETIAILHVYNAIGLQKSNINVQLNEDKFIVRRKIPKECEDNKDNKCFGTVTEIFSMDRNFTFLQRFFE